MQPLTIAVSLISPALPDLREIPQTDQAVLPSGCSRYDNSLTRRIKKHHIVSCIEMSFVTQD